MLYRFGALTIYGAYRMLREKTMDMDIVFRLEDITKHGTHTNLFSWGNRQEQTRTPPWKIQQRQEYGDQAVTNRPRTIEITAPTTEQQIYAEQRLSESKCKGKTYTS
ncbi:hypothetical protein JTB14_037558 [Gonioctena quinquepunctata]|nr:hypothetical protein JTB14_037558 [Gonioctena quinquepunctata]